MAREMIFQTFAAGVSCRDDGLAIYVVTCSSAYHVPPSPVLLGSASAFLSPTHGIWLCCILFALLW
jgi:hypothetical protein